ncbi:MAG: S-layer homology domain-containing protein [Bifidobacteriaceae bacterium]|jgi:hypothetical protein|nr:S-layer homology domain-containing protein [Bifidobacteriaceae bacterium]
MKKNKLFNFRTNEHFIINNLMAIIIIAISFTALPIINLPKVQALVNQKTEKQTTENQASISLANGNQTSNNQAATAETKSHNLTDLPPAPRNIAVAQPNLQSLRVTWTAPATPPANYTYTIELYNNINAVAVTKTDIPQTDTEYLFSNLPANNYTVTKIYTVTADSISSPAISNTVIHNSLNNSGTVVNFKDTNNLSQITRDDITWAQSYNITHGYPDNNWQPNKATTRGQMATFMHRLAGEPTSQSTTLEFTDISKSIHKNDIDWLSSTGITTGYDCTAKTQPVKECQNAGEKVFRPNGFITREQMAIFIYQFAKAPIVTNNDKLQLNRFKDSSTLSNETSKIAVSWLIKAKLTTGYPDAEFKANNLVTRQQMVIFLQSLADQLALVPYLEIENYNPTNFLDTNLNRASITKINFTKSFPQCDKSFDISYNKFNGIKACIDGSKLIIGEPGGVSANPANTDWLLAKLNNTAGVELNIDNLHTKYTQSMINIFNNSIIPSSLKLSNEFGSSATNMSNMFIKASLPAGFSLPSKFGQNATDISSMFQGTSLPAEFNLPNEFGKAAINMQSLFAETNLPKSFSFPKNFGNIAKNMNWMFYNTSLPSDFTLPDEFGPAATSINYMFNKAVFPASFNWPAKFATQAANADGLLNGATFNGNITLPADFGKTVTQIDTLLANATIKGNLVIQSTFPNITTNSNNTNIFQYLTVSGNLSLPDNFLPKATYSDIVFSAFMNSKINNLSIGNNFAPNITNANSVFKYIEINGTLTIGSNFLSNATNSSSMFMYAKIGNLSLPDSFLSKATSVQQLFYSSTINGNLILPNNFLPKATNISFMFYKESRSSINLTIGNNFAPNAANISYMFYNAVLSNGFILPAGFGSTATNIESLFNGATLPVGFTLPAGLGKIAQSMSYMFSSATLNGDIDWSGTDFTASTASKSGMFASTTWNNHFALAQNQISANWLINGTSLSDNTRVKVKGS